jgi:hypothetical protein
MEITREIPERSSVVTASLETFKSRQLERLKLKLAINKYLKRCSNRCLILLRIAALVNRENKTEMRARSVEQGRN